MTPDTLIAWRKALSFNKTQASKALGISRNTLESYETGEHKIPLHINLACAAIYFDLPTFASPIAFQP